MMFGKHAFYIIPSYAISALVIFVLIGWIMAVHRSRKRQIAELEARGIVRGGQKAGKKPRG